MDEYCIYLLEGAVWLAYTYGMVLIGCVTAIYYLVDYIFFLLTGVDGAFIRFVRNLYQLATNYLPIIWIDIYGTIQVFVYNVAGAYALVLPILSKGCEVGVSWMTARVLHPYILYMIYECIFIHSMPTFPFVVVWFLLRFCTQMLCLSIVQLSDIVSPTSISWTSFTMHNHFNFFPVAKLQLDDSNISDAIAILLLTFGCAHVFKIIRAIDDELRRLVYGWNYNENENESDRLDGNAYKSTTRISRMRSRLVRTVFLALYFPDWLFKTFHNLFTKAIIKIKDIFDPEQLDAQVAA